ncbi:hypothetical protein [Rubinisphaera sp.]|uniref:hypothetical protein n=1 Tax=Rubinisphaera sp. TaxID=2024857 RepID=UPI0025D197F2|nr:hypothetical protein [Rubinisphaera sp.]
MSAVIENAFDHMRRTLSALPTATLTKFPGLAGASFKDADKLGGARIELQEMIGQSRVFEISGEDTEIETVLLGQATPSSFNIRTPLRIRYDAIGPSIRSAIKESVIREQLAVIDGLMRSTWSSVSGLVTFQARPSTITSVTLADESGAEYKVLISEIELSFSVDI